MTAITGAPSGRATLAESVVKRLRDDILSGALRPGDRLLSIRKAAEQFGVSKNTIVEAYGRLVDANLVSARQGSGFVVASASDGHQRPRHVAEALDIASLLNAQLEQDFQIRVGDGRPPPSWTEQSEIKRHLSFHSRIPASDADADAYGAALGFHPLSPDGRRSL